MNFQACFFVKTHHLLFLFASNHSLLNTLRRPTLLHWPQGGAVMSKQTERAVCSLQESERHQWIWGGRKVSSCQKKLYGGCFENQDKRTDLEMRMRSFIVCNATSLSLSRVMEIMRSWNKNHMKTHMHRTLVMSVWMCLNDCEHLLIINVYHIPI